MNKKELIIEALMEDYKNKIKTNNKKEIGELYFEGTLSPIGTILKDLTIKYKEDFLFEIKYGVPKSSKNLLGDLKINTIITLSRNDEVFTITESLKFRGLKLLSLKYI